MRKTSGNDVNENYVFFCEKFLKCVVGVQTFNSRWKKCTSVCQITTPSDEALALLLLENSEYRWTYEFEKKEKEEEVQESDLPKPKYTSAGKNKEQRGLTKRYGGWTEEGIQRFNQIMHMVREDRKANGRWFDEAITNRIKQKSVTVQEVQPNNYTKAANDLEDEEENDAEDEDEANYDGNEEGSMDEGYNEEVVNQAAV